MLDSGKTILLSKQDERLYLIGRVGKINHPTEIQIQMTELQLVLKNYIARNTMLPCYSIWRLANND